MRNLILISLLIALQACSPAPYVQLTETTTPKGCLEKFIPAYESVLYNAQINVVGKHLSGLLIVKKMADQSTRVVFSNEMGLKFFDFEFGATNFKVIYCMNKLNKKAVINELKKDIGLILFYNTNVETAKMYDHSNEYYFGFKNNKEINYYITDKSCMHLTRIENSASGKKKMSIQLSGYNKGLPDSVYLTHERFEFNISLKQLER